MNNFFYTRTNEWYEMKNIVKLGMTSNIFGRETNYVTSEPIRGRFSNIYMVELSKEETREMDRKMKEHFKEFNVKSGGGTEFYKVDILDKITVFFEKEGIKFKKLDDNDLKNLDKPDKNKKSKEEEKHVENIDEDYYYDFDTCKIKIREYLSQNPMSFNLLDLYNVSSLLCDMDKKFPPKEKWLSFYKVDNLGEFFTVRKKKLDIVL